MSRKTEGVYVVESEAANGDCDRDDRGPPGNKVCLEERPTRSYWVQTIGNWQDNKIRYPPGIENFNNTESYHGIWLSDVVRSSLWWDEVWKPNQETNSSVRTNYEPDPGDWSLDHVANTTYLTDYGNVPGAFHLPVCRSWNGEAISDTKSKHHKAKHHANAPCLCDSVNPAQRSSWNNPNEQTLKFTRAAVRDGEWYNFNSYGNMCLKHHDCHKQGSWKTFLNLTGDEKPAKHMKHAWTACEFKGHGEHELGPPQLSEPNSTDSTAHSQVSGIGPPDPSMSTPTAPSRQPLIQAQHKWIGNVTRAPKKRSEDGTCEESQCVVDSVYEIVEHSYGFNVDASNPVNGCFAGHTECVEDSAYNLCEHFEDEDEDDEDDDVEEDDEADDQVASEGQSPDDWTFGEGGNSPKENEAMKAFDKEIALTNKRQACFCGGPGMTGQPGIIGCSETGVNTRTTTVKGTTPPASHSSTPTSAAAFGASQVVEVITVTRPGEKTTMLQTVTTSGWQLPSSILNDPMVTIVTVTPQAPFPVSSSKSTIWVQTAGLPYASGYTPVSALAG
jgi:hypothetical protein